MYASFIVSFSVFWEEQRAICLLGDICDMCASE